jgi:hypothetical protein
VLHDVGQQFARKHHHELVVSAGRGRIDRDRDLGADPASAAIRQRAERRRQPGVVKHGPMQLENLGPAKFERGTGI